MAKAPEAGERPSGSAKGQAGPRGYREHTVLARLLRAALRGPRMTSPNGVPLLSQSPHSSPESLLRLHAGKVWVCLEPLSTRAVPETSKHVGMKVEGLGPHQP